MKRITRDVLESYVACHYKAYLKLKLAGDETRFAPDKPNLLLDGNSRLALSSDSVGEVHLQPVKTEAPNSVELTSCYLRKGEPLILGGVFETARISLQIEGLQRVPGSSDIGDFHYLPLVFQSGAEVHKTLNVLLDVYGFILSSFQGRSPNKGIIRKSTGNSTTVQLSAAHKKGERIINALTEALWAEKPPILILNRHCEICEFRSRCHAQAVEEDNLSLLRGISEAEIMRLRNSGIFTINQLSYTFRPRRVKKRSNTPAHPHYFALQARALREKHIFIHGSPNLNAKEVRVYMDFEGTKHNRSYYLIGLLVDHAGETHQKSFWADGDDGEAQIFMEMLDYLKSYRDYSVFHYGAYEVHALRRMQKRLPEKYAREIGGMLKNAINVLAIIGPHIYFPVFSNSLKEIAGVLGHKWSAANASGAQTLLWRRRWDDTQDPRIKDELVRYNMEDCTGLKMVSNFIEQASQHRSTTPNAHTSPLHTDDFEKEVKPRGRFQKQTFVLDEFDYINKCSYFDYQQDKMSARRTMRRQQRTTMANKPVHKVYKNNKVVEIFVSRCPVCRSRKLSSVRPLKRQIVDLKFSGAAVRRWVVLYLSQEYRCRKCKHKFIPDGYPKTRTPFGKGLMFWCMYQMVVGEQNMLRIREGLVRIFGIKLQVPTIYGFKQSISFHYRARYNEILSELLNSHVLYIDETAANLRSETGYVWCITDGRSVHYFYRNSREGSFLGELFKNFRGVLVSDFYTAYDSMDCRQQRCLVHLMRDFNEEMQRHPFDSELKLIGANFSAVLKGAVATIDRYGFKRRHLAKHIKTASNFCQWVSSCEFDSKPAERLRSRIVKYQDQLFTFLDVDDVSWNNTNAEHFIKPFAWYRRTANGVFTERSIKDYLVILSIAETIGGRGEDFLEFLLKDNEHSFSFRSGRRASAEGASQMSFPPPPPPGLG
jgi:predicted RecB family nuclease